MFSFQEDEIMPANIKVIGVGGAGCNAVNTMIVSSLKGVEFIAANTDVQALSRSHAAFKIQLGPERTRGLGAGSKPEVGREAAMESKDRIREGLEGAEMVFVTAGMGGGTGTGAAPIVASIARELGTLTVAVVTKPFQYEGHRRMSHAEEGLRELRKQVDTLLVIAKQRLLGIVDEAASIIREAADPQANIIVGQVINPDMGEDLVITVIATGFDREEPSGKSASLERPSSASVRASQPALAGVRASGGEAPSRNLERPTFLRRLTAKRDGQGRLGLVPDEEWDVPTFLRKQSE